MSKAIYIEKRLLKHALMIILIIVPVVMSAFMVVNQVFNYRHDYRVYNKLLNEKDDLYAELGRLAIEQQTFGATAQIGTRAVTQLRMYSPPASQTVVIATK